MNPTKIELDWIHRWARYSPKQIALHAVEDQISFSYKELDDIIQKMAYHLDTSWNIRKGDRVAVLAMNRWEFIPLFFAVQKLGAILLPINYRLTSTEIDYQLDDASPSLILFEETYQSTINQLNYDGASLCFEGEVGFNQVIEKTTPSSYLPHRGTFDDLCMILYTSGTTGKPKGAAITNKMLFWNSVNTGLRLNLTQNDKSITFAPFFHTGGWNVLTTPLLHRGATVYLMKKFDPDTVLSLTEKEEITILFGVPTMMDFMAQSSIFKKAAFHKLRYAIVGGEPMPLPLIKTWQEKGVPIRQGYGLTEFGPNVFSLNEEDSIRKIGSIGFPNFYIQTKIVDDEGKEVGVNEPGELLLKGPVCMAGYWNNVEATQKTIQNEWLYTGDIVKVDEEGYFYVVDRKKELYISGAENVYPAEIEHVFRTHPSIKEIAVIGVPDSKWGEVGKAFIVLKDGKSEEIQPLIQWAKQRLATYKVPKHYTFINELPKSDSGKILKRLLKED